jgi:hypothetical protein
MDAELSDEELEELLAPQLKDFSARASRRLTAKHLIHGWSKFVAEVEKGYNKSIYEYHNDLDTRGLLERLMAGGPDVTAKVIGQRIGPWDRRFEAATREVPYIVATFDIGPWARRVPIRPGDELAADLVDSEAEWQENQKTV